MKIDFCLPAYNEAHILEASVRRLVDFCRGKGFPFVWKVVVLINGSDDSSSVVAAKLKDAFKEEVDFRDYQARGRGQALKKYWLESPADILVYMDVDLAVSLDDIEKLVEPLLSGKGDLAIGSRLLPQSKIERSLSRELVSQTYNLVSRLVLRHKFSDMQCGFKAIRKSVFLEIAGHLRGEKWFFDTEMIVFTNFFGYRVVEVPVDWEEARYDKRKSKVNVFRDVWLFLSEILALRRRLIKMKSLKISQKTSKND